jgi:L-erythro-3,5-diaminohexanoate dehydrogenase
MKEGNKFGAHRVIEPTGVLPQPAWKIDNTMEIYDNEILIEVDTLNIDAASFTQIEEAEGGDVLKMARHSLGIIKDRGKHHNPDTGSGGMLLGTVKEIGPKLVDRDLKVGDRIATLVSLSLTPLNVQEIISTNKDTCQVKVRGQAILFESGIYAKMPSDMDEAFALAVLDVAGAPAQAAKLCKPGQTVFIIGAGGKSGLLCAYEARKRVGITGKVIGLVHGNAGKKRLERTGFCDAIFQGSATDQLFVYDEMVKLTEGKMADLTINCVDIPNTEMSSVLATKDDGMVYFFSMATSFTSAALGAEGIGADTLMIIGNGYTKDHAAISLACVRESPILMEIFKETYATGAGNPEPVGIKASEV